MNLDPRSMIALAGFMSAVMAVVLLFMRRHYPPSIRGVGAWAAAPLLWLASTILFSARGLIPDWLSLVLANQLLVLGTVTYYMGTRSFMGQPLSWRLWSWVIAASTLVFVVLMVVFQGLSPRGGAAYDMAAAAPESKMPEQRTSGEYHAYEVPGTTASSASNSRASAASSAAWQLAVKAITRHSSLLRRMRSSVEAPTDPVAPRIEIERISLSGPCRARRPRSRRGSCRRSGRTHRRAQGSASRNPSPPRAA